ncbi:MAG TPA: hypothetical protein ENK18_16630 [Deltaproteobacteria bacterium]|nr:hypothetical protein [Deltaproteobacteria bacterium]
MKPMHLLIVSLFACKTPAPKPVTTPTPSPAPAPITPPDAEVIELLTRDDVTLEADWYDSGVAGGPAFVLLHMIPPTYDRTSWPAAFIDRLIEQGWSVLVLDRRGAGASEGLAIEAYEGPDGKLDVEAATRFLQDRAAGPLAIIGASNGTTSMLDYTVWAGGEGLPAPVAVGLMTGGTYTENQNSFSSLPPIPAVFTYSTAERAWSEDQRPLDPGSWSFLEYEGGAHGTQMFDVKPKVKGDLVDFFASVFRVDFAP